MNNSHSHASLCPSLPPASIACHPSLSVSLSRSVSPSLSQLHFVAAALYSAISADSTSRTADASTYHFSRFTLAVSIHRHICPRFPINHRIVRRQQPHPAAAISFLSVVPLSSQSNIRLTSFLSDRQRLVCSLLSDSHFLRFTNPLHNRRLSSSTLPMSVLVNAALTTADALFLHSHSHRRHLPFPSLTQPTPLTRCSTPLLSLSLYFSLPHSEPLSYPFSDLTVGIDYSSSRSRQICAIDEMARPADSLSQLSCRLGVQARRPTPTTQPRLNHQQHQQSAASS